MTQQKIGEWVKTLKAGDVVAIHGGGYGFNIRQGVVEKVTPTGRVRLAEERREFNPDGYERGAAGYRRSHIGPWTEEVANQVRHHHLSWKLGNVKWEKEPLVVLERVMAVLSGPQP